MKFLPILALLILLAIPSSSPRAANFDEFEDLIDSANELNRGGNYAAALEKCAQAALLRPDDYRPHAISGFAYKAQRKLKSASESFARAIERNPKLKPLYIEKAKADDLRQAKEDAVATCRKLLEIDPKNVEAYLLIGQAFRYKDETRDESIAAFQAVLKLNPALIDAYVDLAETLVAAKNEKLAEESFRQAMALDRNKMAGRFELGRVLVRQGRLKDARELWEGRTTSIENTYPNFITVLERAERLKAATDGLAEKPDDPDGLAAMGLALLDEQEWVHNDRQTRAIEFFKKALVKKSNHKQAQFGLVKAMIERDRQSPERKDLKATNAELTKLRRLDPKLGKQLDEYRKTFQGALFASPIDFNQ